MANKRGRGHSPVGHLVRAEISAKATLKGEIPKDVIRQASGKIWELLSPFTEGMGLIGDHIRLHREDVLIQLADKVQERLSKEETPVFPIPSKALVPMLEKASLEEPGSDLIDTWAALMASASTDYRSEVLTYIDVLSKIGPDEVKLVDAIAGGFRRFNAVDAQIACDAGRHSAVAFTRKHLAEERVLVFQDSNGSSSLEYRPGFLDAYQASTEASADNIANRIAQGMFEEIAKELIQKAVLLMNLRFPYWKRTEQNGRYYWHEGVGRSNYYQEKGNVFHVLHRENLIRVVEREFPMVDNGRSCTVTWAEVTPLGIGLVLRCGRPAMANDTVMGRSNR